MGPLFSFWQRMFFVDSVKRNFDLWTPKSTKQEHNKPDESNFKN